MGILCIFVGVLLLFWFFFLKFCGVWVGIFCGLILVLVGFFNLFVHFYLVFVWFVCLFYFGVFLVFSRLFLDWLPGFYLFLVWGF